MPNLTKINHFFKKKLDFVPENVYIHSAPTRVKLKSRDGAAR